MAYSSWNVMLIQLVNPVVLPQIVYNPIQSCNYTTPTIDSTCYDQGNDTKPDITDLLLNFPQVPENICCDNADSEWIDVTELQDFSPGDDVTGVRGGANISSLTQKEAIIEQNEHQIPTRRKRIRKQITFNFEDNENEAYEDSGEEWTAEGMTEEEYDDDSEETEIDCSKNKRQKLAKRRRKQQIMTESINTEGNNAGSVNNEDFIVEEKFEIEGNILQPVEKNETTRNNGNVVISQTASSQWYNCILCSYVTDLKVDIVFHLKSQKHKRAVEEKERCQVIEQQNQNGNSTNSGDATKAKMGNKQGKQQFRCRFCNYGSKKNAHVLRHTIAKHIPADKIKWYRCEICNFLTKAAESLQRHCLTRKHVNAVDAAEKFSVSKFQWYQCEKCDFKTAVKDFFDLHFQYKKHIDGHGHGNGETTTNREQNEASLQKNYEEEASANNGNHKCYQHSPADEIIWYKCDICNLKTKSSLSFQIHLLSKKHKEQAGKRNPLCEMEQTEESTIDEEHVVIEKTNERKQTEHRCAQCTYLAESELDLNIHVLEKHTLTETATCHTCRICNFTTEKKYCLQLHLVSREHKDAVSASQKKQTSQAGANEANHSVMISEERIEAADSVEQEKNPDMLETNAGEDISTLKEKEASEILKQNEDRIATKSKRIRKQITEVDFEDSENEAYEAGGEEWTAETSNSYDWTELNVEEDTNENEDKKSDSEDEIEAKFKCPHCKYKTNWKNNMTKHVISRHTSSEDIQWFHCAHCSYKAKTKEYLSKHWELVHNKLQSLKWIYCDKCTYKTKISNYLKRHVITNHTELEDIKWFTCDDCPYRSKIKCELRVHVKNRHLPKTWFYCDNCHFKTTNKKVLKRHRKRHGTDIKVYRCRECPHQLYNLQKIVRHTALHGDKNSGYEESTTAEVSTSCEKNECFDRVSVNGKDLLKCVL